MKKRNILPNDLFGKEFNLTEAEVTEVTNKLLNVFEVASPNYFTHRGYRKDIIEIILACIKERYVDQLTFQEIGEKRDRSADLARQWVTRGMGVIRKQKLTKELYKEYLEGKEIL